MIYAIIIIGAIALDRVVKHLIVSDFAPGDTISVVGDFFHITYVQNSGVAFSMLENHEMLIMAATGLLLSLGMAFLALFFRRYPPMFDAGLALVCGGGLSNLIDRKMNGYVIDMFDFGSFPVFNVADICICVGCGLMVLYAFRSLKEDEK